MGDVYRIFEERFDRVDDNLDRISKCFGVLRGTNKCLAGLEHEARQPRLTMETDVEPDIKTRKRTKNAAADRAKHGDKSFSTRVDHGDDFTEPPAPEKSIGDFLVDKKGAKAPKSYV